ncbi:response regulator transcription factor [Pseudomonas chlororaphis]|uniref:response regulator transcription factor n=1 Tax=Pseudomonas chlororaphis TaxID=587753 RepID=UPI00236575C8|nr:response regulator [Pseudomonas chlororaphis]WDH19955.1 response regulator [Pseudomonas chlororaphis]
MPQALLIAIIDDDESLRLATSSLLRSMDYMTEHFASTEDFLDSGDASRFACIIADIQMPGVSGIDLTYRLMTADDTAKVILMTARTEQDIHERARTSGAAYLLQKPFEAQRLLNCLEALLTSQIQR